MAEATKKGRARPAGPKGRSNRDGTSHGKGVPLEAQVQPTCSVGFCPICLAVTAMQPLRPDVIEHLLVAGREFLLAAKAVLDARSEQFDGNGADRPGSRRSNRLEKIDIG
jgi:hypothetical protein